MLYSICKEKKHEFAKLLSPQITKKIGSAKLNPQSVTFMEGPQSNKLFKSANLRICGTYLRTTHLLGMTKKLRLG
jgi:hypothetical protein